MASIGGHSTAPRAVHPAFLGLLPPLSDREAHIRKSALNSVSVARADGSSGAAAVRAQVKWIADRLSVVSQSVSSGVEGVQLPWVAAYSVHEEVGEAVSAVEEIKAVRKSSSERGWQHFVAGNMAGVIGLTVSYPLDTVKVRIQTNPAVYKGMVRGMNRMVRKEGFMALYRGLMSPVLGYGVINSVAFGTYGKMCMILKDRERDRLAAAGTPLPADNDNVSLPLLQVCFAGSVAGVAQSFIRSPVERIKTLCQATHRPDGSKLYKGSLDCLVKVARTDGVMSLMQGLWPTILREMPQYAMYYPLYEMCKRAITPAGVSPDEVSPARLAVAGAAAGALQWLPPMYSVDVIKSRIQGAGPGQYKGFMDCVRKSYKKDGARVFVRGLTPALVRAVPLHGSIFVVYEMTMRMLRGLTHESDLLEANGAAAE